MKKRMLAVILTVGMLTPVLAGCGSSSASSGSSSGTADTTAKDAATATTDTADTTSTDTSASGLDPVTLKMYFEGANVTDDSEAMDALNKYLQEKINGYSSRLNHFGSAGHVLSRLRQNQGILATTPMARQRAASPHGFAYKTDNSPR